MLGRPACMAPAPSLFTLAVTCHRTVCGAVAHQPDQPTTTAVPLADTISMLLAVPKIS